MIHQIAEKENFEIEEISSLHGGDINQVYKLKTPKKNLVVKINSALGFPKMFEKESQGLELLQSSNSFKVPKILGFGEIGQQAYLLLEYLSTSEKPADFWTDFAEKLALLHQNQSEFYGLESDNYIGSLKQINKPKTTDPIEFFVHNRIQTQVEIAFNQGFPIKKTSSFYKNLESLLPKEKASLIHGDLWAGNYLCHNEEPVLIDPAVAYASREMDLAMMKLFGGFSNLVFEEYNQYFPLAKNWEERIEIWQLYYLLVHLNLFGTGYLSSVNQIISRFS